MPTEDKAKSLSLAMIVKDEEKIIGRCLESVTGVFDQIVIVDTGSKDRTKDIAASFGAEIYDFAWIDDFSAARNFAFSKAKSDFVMWLDADDIFKPEDRQKLLGVKEALGNDADAYHMKYDVAFDEFGNTTFSYFRERLVRNNQQACWKAPIHEVLIIPPEWKKAFVDVHVTHAPPVEKFARDPGRNLRMLKKAIEKFPDDRRLRYYHARELLSAGEVKEAIQRFNEYIEEGQDWHENVVNAHLQLASAYRSRGDTDKAIETYLRGIKLDPRWAEFPAAIGQIYYENNDWLKAIYWFEIAARCKVPQTEGFVQHEDYTIVPHDRLCVSYWQVGDRCRSYAENESALSYKPKDKRLLANREVMRNIMFPDWKAERPIRLAFRPKDPIPGYRAWGMPEDPVNEALRPQGVSRKEGAAHSVFCDLLQFSAKSDVRVVIEEFGRVLRHNGELIVRAVDLGRCGPMLTAGAEGAAKLAAAAGAAFGRGEIGKMLEDAGFKVERVVEIELGEIPIVEIRSIQKRRPLSVRWLVQSEDQGNHSLRVRVLNVHGFIVAKGIDSSLVCLRDDEDGMFEELRSADVVVLTSYGQIERALAGRLRRVGVAVICELSHEMAEVPGMHEALWSASMVVSPSEAWAGLTKEHSRTVVIPDAYEPGPERIRSNHELGMKVLWCGPKEDAANVDPIRPFMDEVGAIYTALSDAPGATKQWKENWLVDLAAADVVVLPERHWTRSGATKSNYRATQAQSMGIPVLVSKIASYCDTVKVGTGLVCDALEDWRTSLRSLMDPDLRARIGQAAKQSVEKDYGLEAVGLRWIDLLERLSAENGSPPEVDVVIPTYNNLEYLRLTIESLRRTTDWPHRVIVVDSGDDESAEWLEKQRDVMLVRSQTRMHFSEAVNAGIAASKAPYVCMLNNDVVLTENWLLWLMSEAVKPGVGLVGPISNCGKGMYHEKDITIAGKKLEMRMALEDVADIIPQIEAYRHPKAIFNRFWIPFFATVASKETLMRVGPLDEKFKNGYEDMDYCSRARNLGFAVRDTQDAFVFHFTERTRYRKDLFREEEDRENKEYYEQKMREAEKGQAAPAVSGK